MFVVHTMALALPMWYLGKATDRLVGRRGKLSRIVANALVLYVLYVLYSSLVGVDITLELQGTLPGIVACAAFVNSQRWDADHLF